MKFPVHMIDGAGRELRAQLSGTSIQMDDYTELGLAEILCDIERIRRDLIDEIYRRQRGENKNVTAFPVAS
jgi:hypothetical protein